MYKIIIIIQVVVTAIFAANENVTAILSCDNTTFQGGDVFFTNIRVKAMFYLKNKGNAVLYIEKVTPGCGCTKVKFDSIILPQKTGIINASFHLDTIWQSGKISKFIKVKSNAANLPELNLGIEVNVKTPIDIVEQPVLIKGANIKAKDCLVSATTNDLIIYSIMFHETIHYHQSSISWGKNSEFASPIKFQFIKIHHIASDSLFQYGLKLIQPNIESKIPVIGELIINTNHPKMPIVKVPAVIQD